MRRERRDTRGAKACVVGIGCVLLGALGHPVVQAFADDDPTTSSVLGDDLILPYDAHLQIDAQGAHGTLRMRFELFEAPTGGAPEWTEEQLVSLSNGDLSVGLGAVTPLTPTLLDAQRLWLGITVIEDDGQGGTTELPLAGRQAISPVPFAAWSANAADFAVASSARVAGEFLTGASVSVAGQLYVRGSDVHLGTANGAGFGDGGRALTLDTASDTLRLNVGGDFTGGSVIGGEATIEDTLTVLGDATLGSPAGEIILDGDATAGELELGGDISTFGSSSIDHIHTLQGSAGMTFQSGQVSSGVFELDSAGNVSVTGDLDVTGRLMLKRDDAQTVSGSSATVDLGLNEDEGFCYLGSFSFLHSAAALATSCFVRLGSLDEWQVQITNDNAQASVGCTAFCVRY